MHVTRVTAPLKGITIAVSWDPYQGDTRLCTRSFDHGSRAYLEGQGTWLVDIRGA